MSKGLILGLATGCEMLESAMGSTKCPICGVESSATPYHDRDVQFIACPACGNLDVPTTTELLILRGLSPEQRAVLSFWLRRENHGETPLVLTDELAKSIVKEKRLPTPDQQEENIIRAVGAALASGESGLTVDLRFFASTVGAPDEKTLRQLVAGLQRKGLLTGFRNTLMVETGEINQLHLGLTPDGFRNYRGLESSAQAQATSSKAKVFFSHAASDKSLALLLKAEIERRLPRIGVFCSSDPSDLPPGTKWSPEIQQALQESRMLLFIASERGIERPWVWFECGTFWFTGRKILPICLGEIRKNALRPPLSELQSVNGDEPSDLKIALDCVAAATGAKDIDTANLEALSQELNKLDRELALISRTSSGWLGAEWKGRFLAYEGPYENLPLIEDAIFESSMQQALETAGYRVALYDENNFRNIGDAGRFVQLTDRKTFRRRVAQGTMWLVARPA